MLLPPSIFSVKKFEPKIKNNLMDSNLHNYEERIKNTCHIKFFLKVSNVFIFYNTSLEHCKILTILCANY